MDMKGFTDIHSHIIYGVDDGSRSVEDSTLMLKQAYDEGVRVMYATPHFGSGKERYDSVLLRERYEEVAAIAGNTGDEGISLILGNEVTYSGHILEDLHSGRALTMGGSRYVLVEFDYETSFKHIFNGMQELVRAGYRPILAHIERYYCLIKNYKDIVSLRELGVSLQLNAASVIPKLSNEASFCRKLIREGYIQFLGSDAHRPDWRPPVMKKAVEVLGRKTPERYLDRILYSNPKKLSENEFI